jgi:hypothetical protein
VTLKKVVYVNISLFTALVVPGRALLTGFSTGGLLDENLYVTLTLSRRTEVGPEDGGAWVSETSGSLPTSAWFYVVLFYRPRE